MPKKRVAIVGAGPGGLACAMLLAHKGYEVDVFEKQPHIGGRNARLQVGDYIFDTGPTFFMMPFILEEIFRETGREVRSYMELKLLNPLYRLRLPSGKDFHPKPSVEETLSEIDAVFPGESEGYRRYMQAQKTKFEKALPILQDHYDKFTDMFSTKVLRALPYLDLHTSVHGVAAKFMKDEELRLAMTFQAKYLGMSPWECPGFFAIVPFVEHEWGIHHPIGGLNKISEGMAKVVEEEGGNIHLHKPVKEVVVANGKATGVKLEDGTHVEADAVVLNADIAYALEKLIPQQHRKKWTDKRLASKRYSCSTFMLYLGIDKQYDIPHHTVVFSQHYRNDVDNITRYGTLSDDPSFYMQNASITDPTLAPEGHSALYILVPVANTGANIDWKKEAPRYRELLLQRIAEKTELKDIREHIVAEKMITPDEWRDNYNVYRGAVFSMAHNTGQMLAFRPHNRYEDIQHCYLAGGGTHPGSGLPTIFEAGRICADLIEDDIGTQ